MCIQSGDRFFGCLSLKIFKMWPKLFTIFLLISGATVNGNFEDELEKGSYLDELADQLILHIVKIVRLGLLDAKVDALPIPDFDWHIDVDNLVGVFELREMTVFGIPDFIFENVSTSLIQRKLELALNLPVIGVKGQYDFNAKFVGVPIFGRGAFAATFTKIDVAGGIQLNPAVNGEEGTLFSIKISSPFLSLGKLDLALEGLMGRWTPVNLVLIILAIFIGYTLLVLGVQWLMKKVRNRVRTFKNK